MILFSAVCLAGIAAAANRSTAGIEALVARRLPQYADRFQFSLMNTTSMPNVSMTSSNLIDSTGYDAYTVSMMGQKIQVSSATLSGLNRGLYAYLSEIAGSDIYWTGSYLNDEAVPMLNKSLSGSGIVKWRYYFNTVTFSYTAAFWSWKDWELELDWLALRGVNLPLAWVGFEKTFIDTFTEVGLSDSQISSFLSGPAFQGWNRFGNIQGSWNGTLPMAWVNQQFTLGKQIVNRMVELGMTPVMPSFAGFVPRDFAQVVSGANLTNSSMWNKFPLQFTNDSFLEPGDPVFASLQQSFISKQKADFGNVSSIYTLDQFNENTPASGNLTYLSSVSFNTWKALKNADPNAVWLMQGWLFFSQEKFWTNDKVQAFLDGVTNNEDMLILDLFSEAQPQWQRTQSYYGKPWIWCFLHDYGQNMGLFGNLQNETVNPLNALHANTTMVGMGVTMEGQEGNELTYDLFLDQAWSKTPIDTFTYVRQWISRRYGEGLPTAAFDAWEMLRTSVYGNNNSAVQAVTKSILELTPNITNLLITGHHPTVIPYNTSLLVSAWRLLLNATYEKPALMEIDAFHYDLTDVTRQVLANSFLTAYNQLISEWNSSNSSAASIRQFGSNLTSILTTLDKILYTDPNFLLSKWIGEATTSANSSNTTVNDYFEYNARNQITLWGPTGEISDYASKEWAGLVGKYYLVRWQMFVSYLSMTSPQKYNYTAFAASLRTQFEQEWNAEEWSGPWTTQGNLLNLIETDELLLSM